MFPRDVFMARPMSETASEPSPLRKNRKFRALMATTVANEFSAAMAGVVLPLLILLMTHSATMAGVAAFIVALATIGTQLISGAVADRFAPDRTLRLSSLAQALAWGGLALASLFWALPVWAVICAAAIAGIASSLDGPSEHALVKIVVPQRQLGRAAAVSQGRESAAELLGGPAGGALFGLLATLPLFGQAILHTIAAIISPRLGSGDHTREAIPGARDSFKRDLIRGYHIVARHRGLRGTALVAGIANLPIVMLPLALIAYYQENGIGAFQIGIFSSSFGVGIFLGALGAGWLTARIRLGILGVGALTAFALGQIFAIISHHDFWLTCLILAISALPLPAFNAAIGSYTIAITPADMMGRVSAAVGVPGMILMPVGLLLGGVLYDHIGITLTLIISASAASLAAVVMWLSPELRAIPMLDELAENAGT